MKKTIAIALCLVAGVANAQTFVVNNLQINGTVSATNAVPLGALAQQAANTVVANTSAIPASPSAVTVPSCSGTGSALQWISGTGFSCGSFQPSSQFPSSPYAFGAVGNGVADDTVALQNWITTMGATGQAGYCSPGTYKITKTLNVAGSAVKIGGPGGNACAITPSMPVGPTVSSATAGATYNPGAAPSIRLTVSSTANILGAIEVSGVNGTTEANGGWPVAVIDSTHVDIIGPTFSHAYTSGGTVTFPALAVVPFAVPNSSIQPQLDLSGVYFAPPTTNAGNTDAIIITGGAFNSPGSNVDIYNNVINGYRRGMIFWQSFSPILRYNYIYNSLGSAIVATQDGSFSNAHIEYNQMFSNGNTVQEAALSMGGAFLVENPNVFGNQASGNWDGINLNGNVVGGQFIGNYLENNNVGVGFNIGCNGSNNNGNQFIGNWLFFASGTNVTNLASCTGSFWSGNFQTNNTFTLAQNSVVTTTNTLSGSAGINYPSVLPSSVVANAVSHAAITSGAATTLTSVSLGSGNWACTGATWTNADPTTTQSFNVTALSLTSGVFPSTAPGEVSANSSTPGGISVGQTVAPVYYSFASTTSVFLVAQVNYAVANLTINGDIHCQRVF